MAKVSRDGYEPAHLSFSTISTMRMCGAKFFFQKVLQKEERPGLAALGGNVVHTVTELFDLGEWIPSSSNVDNGTDQTGE